MLSLAVHKPNESQAAAVMPALLSKLPIKEDEEEAKKVHKIVVEQLMAENQVFVGGDNLQQILRILAEVYKQENLCEKETDEKIVQVFKGLPRDLIVQHAANFSEKQQKKIERILTY